jgi:hypothetical protein
MWHWPHWDYKAVQFARQLTYSLELSGKKVFPNGNTCWHYDDKLGQKYLLEATKMPLVPTYAFYNRDDAFAWLEKTTLPKVFKTRNGAGSQNVKLIKTKKQAKKLIKKSFATGIPGYSKSGAFKESIWMLKRDKNLKSIGRVLKYLTKLFLPDYFQPEFTFEKNYVYFQEFIPNNLFDIRVIVVGERAFAIKRMVRDNDFRASGSGKVIYAKENFSDEIIRDSFALNEKLKTQSLAIDYVFLHGKSLIVELSYAFSQQGYLPCVGFWDKQLKFHEGTFYPERFMIEDFLNSIQTNI